MSLKSLLQPSSIAIVGVSHEPHKVGHLIASNILHQGFKGELYFVNPHGEKILGKRVYHNLADIHKPIDLVVLAVPADIALLYLKEMFVMRIPSGVIIAAGFKEMGEAGQKREQELIQKAKEYNLTLLGPNCLGFINTQAGINATFLKNTCPPGNIGFISQSGALGSAIVDYFNAHNHLGLSYFMSLGNKTVVDESDCLEFLADDEKTEVIAMYLEDIKDPDRFRSVLKKVTRKKPVVVLKSGATQEGSKAAVSHTGGLVGDDAVYTAVFRQAGAIRAQHYDEFLTLLKLFSYKKVPTSSSVLVLSNAGGVGVLFTDDVIKNGLHLETISEKTCGTIQQTIQEKEMKKITVHNPIDLLGDASAFDYKAAIDATIQEKDVGAVVILLTPQANTEISQTAHVIAQAQAHFDRPIIPVFMGESSVDHIHTFFENHRIMSFPTYDPLAGVLEKVLWYEHMRKLPAEPHFSTENLFILAHEHDILDTLGSHEGEEFLNLFDSMSVLEHAGVPTQPLHYIEHEEEIGHILRKINFPVVAKIASDKITHKTEVKGVITNIKTKDELKEAYKSFRNISGSDGCYVQTMMSGTELFIGAKRDPHMGVVVIVGLGGIYAELLKSITQFIYPFSEQEFRVFLEHSHLEMLEKGFRGLPKLNIAELYAVADKIGYLVSRFHSISSLDINPLFLTDKGLTAVDARIIL